MKKLFLKFIETVVSPFYGKKKFQSFFEVLYHISLRGMNYRNSEILEDGESFLLDHISDYYKNKGKDKIILFDVGANKGDYTKFVRDNFDKKKLDFTIYCFEPMPATFKILSANFSGDDRVKPVNVGIGKVDSVATIYSNHDQSELASLYKQDMHYLGIDFNFKTDIQIKNLDGFCQENGINKIHFLKIDTEGGEYDILKNSPSMVKQADFIQFEFGTSNVESKTFMKDFFDVLGTDFKLYRILKDGLYLFEEYHQDREIMVLSNFVAISKNTNDFTLSK